MLQAAVRAKYIENTIQTATPAQLLIMLYDGAIRFCKLGIEAIKQKDYSGANTNLTKAQAILDELLVTLDRESELAKTLIPLYQYMKQQLIQGNVKKDTRPVEEVLGYMTDLKETWIIAAKSANLPHAQG